MLDDVKPPEVLMVNKNVFVSCLRALGTFLDVKSENFETFRQSDILPIESRRVILDLLKHDLQVISQITHALEASMDYDIPPDESKGFLN